MKTEKLRKEIDRILTLRADRKQKLEQSQKELKELKQNEEYASKALLILQTTAKKTQEQLEYKIGELVSLAESAVFDNPYKLRLIYEMKRNKTEANLLFERGGKLINPLDSGGYGAADVASFALRPSLWSLRTNKLDNVLLYDEPFRHVNDDTRRLHRHIAEMVKEISVKLNMQFIILSRIPELREVADSVFKVTMKDGISHVKEV